MEQALIAIVDDDESVRDATARLMRSAGFSAETFSCGADLTAAEDANLPWWEWVQKHCDFRARVMQEAVGECLAHFQKEARDHCDRECTLMNRELAITRKELETAGDARALASKELHDAMARELAATKRELELLKQQFVILREQVGLADGLRSLRTEVEDARAQMPQIPATVTRLEAAQMHLEREVDKTKNRLAKGAGRSIDDDLRAGRAAQGIGCQGQGGEGGDCGSRAQA
jgi:hypothetical protein